MRIRKVTLVLAAACGAVFVLAALTLALRLQHRVIVVNESGQRLDFLSVTIGGETIRFVSVPEGATVSAPFRIHGDDHFEFLGQMTNGTRFDAVLGYVTGGWLGVRAWFAVQPDGTVRHWQTQWP